METGAWNHESKAEDCQSNRDSNHESGPTCEAGQDVRDKINQRAARAYFLEVMKLFLVVLGFLGTCACIILLIKAAIAKTKNKVATAGVIFFLILFFVGVGTYKTTQDRLRESFQNEIGDADLLFRRFVQNDATGKWRECIVYTSKTLEGLEQDYYEAFFASDDEIHFYVNLYLKTTTIMRIYNGKMQVEVHEYIRNEENDAKLLGGGMLYQQYIINLS